MKLETPPKNDRTPDGELEEGGIHDLLGYQLAQATIVTTSAFDRAVGKPLALRPVEFTMLQLIRENAPVTATKVAQALAVTVPGVTMWLDRLERRGLVERKRSEADKRVQNLSVTPEGLALVSSALTQLLEADQVILQRLSRGERHLLIDLLHKVASAR